MTMEQSEYVKKEKYDQLLKMVTELLEMQKKSQKQTDELINMYSNSLNVLENNIDSYRNYRINFVRNNSPFWTLSQDPAMFIHIAPQNYKSERVIDLSSARELNISKFMFPLYSNSYDFCFNSDGFSSFYMNKNNAVQAYDQILRNGIYESYSSVSFIIHDDDDNNRYIIEEKFKTSIIKKITDGITVLSNFNITPPFDILISLIDISDIYINRIAPFRDIGPFNLDSLLLQKFTVDNNEDSLEIDNKLTPLLDIIWQTCGAKGYNK